MKAAARACRFCGYRFDEAARDSTQSNEPASLLHRVGRFVESRAKQWEDNATTAPTSPDEIVRFLRLRITLTGYGEESNAVRRAIQAVPELIETGEQVLDGAYAYGGLRKAPFFGINLVVTTNRYLRIVTHNATGHRALGWGEIGSIQGPRTKLSIALRDGNELRLHHVKPAAAPELIQKYFLTGESEVVDNSMEAGSRGNQSPPSDLATRADRPVVVDSSGQKLAATSGGQQARGVSKVTGDQPAREPSSGDGGQPPEVTAVGARTGGPATGPPIADGEDADRATTKEPACLGSVGAALLSLPITFVGMAVLASYVDWGDDPIESAALPLLLVLGGFIFFVAPLLIAASMARPAITALGSTIFLVAVIALTSGTADPPREAATPTPPARDENRSDGESRAQRSERAERRERRRRRARAERRKERSGTNSSTGDSDLIRKYCSEQNPGFFAQDQQQACESGLAE